MSAHTPGPWSGRPSHDPVLLQGCEEAGLSIAFACGGGDPRRAEFIANARLIAAAPELLEAATRIMAAMRSVFTFSDMADDEWIYDELGSDLAGAYFDARAAIAKATGETA